MENFFIKNLDIVFFVYGLAFIITGIAILSQPKDKSEFKLANILWLLAAFCLTHGANEFLDMWVIIKGRGQVYDAFRLWVLAVSFVLFFEFGRRLLRSAISVSIPFYNKLSRLLSNRLLLIPAVVIAIGMFVSEHDWNTGVTIARYLLAFPGGIMIGSGFILYYRFNHETLDAFKVKKHFLVAAITFIVYGVLAGLIVPKGNLFLSPWLNTDSFLLSLHVPVQVLRAVCALVAAWAVCGILRIFNWEKEELLKTHADTLEIVNKQLHSEISHRKVLEEKLRALSLSDSLTGLFNRRGFLTLGEHQMKVAKRNKQDMRMIFADLDNLKWINDSFGHHEGDLALVGVANIFKASFRESDIVARVGGDEFAVLLIQADREYDNDLIERLQNHVDEYNAKTSRSYTLSLSIGIASCDVNESCTINELLSRADKLMYEQKQFKKNHITA